MANLFTLRVFARNLLRGSCWKCLTGDLNRGLMSNKPTPYLLGSGHFNFHFNQSFRFLMTELKIIIIEYKFMKNDAIVMAVKNQNYF